MTDAAPIHPDFAHWQPLYAAHNIATFPVAIGADVKRPAVRGYLKIGSDRSRQLAQQFPDAQAFGFACGEKSGIAVLDIDSSSEKIAADAFDRYGKTPLIVRSGGHGNFQGWYRWSGEGRRIRPDKSQPIDTLGRGFVVAPPSQGRAGQYEIIEGSLDDLDRLPPMKGGGALAALGKSAAAAGLAQWGDMRDGSGRNDALFRQLGREAHSCDDFEQLLDRAQWLNEQFGVPMEAARVVSVARSVWKMTAEGRNRFGKLGAFFALDDINRLIGNPYLLALLNWLRAHNSPDAVFMVADGLAEILGWPRRRFTEARREAIEGGWIIMAVQPAKGRAARYRWPSGAAALASGPLGGPLARRGESGERNNVSRGSPTEIGRPSATFVDLPKAVGRSTHSEAA